MNRSFRSRRSSKRKQSSKKSHETRKKRSVKCKPITTKRVCGPVRSCRYPNAYSRKKILKLASRDQYIKLEFNKPLSRVSNEQLCSHLGLATKESVQFNRIINGRKCGPIPSSLNPNVWTKEELLAYISKHKISSLSRAKSMHREELCALAADWSYKHRTSKSLYKLPEAGLDLYPIFKWKEGGPITSSFIYFLLMKYPNSYFFVSPSKVNFNGVKFNCIDQKIDIHPDLISQMKKCKVRFFFTLIGITRQDGKHANFLLYDKERNEIWHYEPLRGGKYYECNTDLMFVELNRLFKTELNRNIKFTTAPEYCPNLNLSRFIYKQKHKGFNPTGIATGLCIAVNLWMIENKLSHPNMSPPEVNAAAINALKEHEYGALNHILNWINRMIELRDQFLINAKDEGINERTYFAKLVRNTEKNRRRP